VAVGVGIVDVVSATGMTSEITSAISDSGEGAGVGGMATVVAAGDWVALSHPDSIRPPNTIMAETIQTRDPADFVMALTPSGALTPLAIDDDGRNRASPINPCCYRTFPRPASVEVRASTEANGR
jgi:hypothetical protein